MRGVPCHQGGRGSGDGPPTALGAAATVLPASCAALRCADMPSLPNVGCRPEPLQDLPAGLWRQTYCSGGRAPRPAASEAAGASRI